LEQQSSFFVVYTAQLPLESFFGFKSGYLPFEQQTFWPSPNFEQRSVLLFTFMKSDALILHFEGKRGAAVAAYDLWRLASTVQIAAKQSAWESATGAADLLIFYKCVAKIDGVKLSEIELAYSAPSCDCETAIAGLDCRCLAISPDAKTCSGSKVSRCDIFAALVVLVLFMKAPSTGLGTRRLTVI
jgi:hypothetical protein